MSKNGIITLYEEIVEYQKLNFQADSGTTRIQGTRVLLELLLETAGVSEEAVTGIATFMTMACMLVVQPGLSG